MPGKPFTLTTAGGSVLLRTHNLPVVAHHVKLANARRYATFVREGRGTMYELHRTRDAWALRGSYSEREVPPWLDSLVRQLNANELPAKEQHNNQGEDPA